MKSRPKGEFHHLSISTLCTYSTGMSANRFGPGIINGFPEMSHTFIVIKCLLCVLLQARSDNSMILGYINKLYLM